ncbi:MAG: TRAP-type transport system large permease protein [Thermococcaceae archaeon]|nr:TRAP-type transport system large permease protein [Thermococcaceae archaeon]MDN5320695.1 TRAP-type transport system large permease protein [Thermococcaceae archaeon]
MVEATTVLLVFLGLLIIATLLSVPIAFVLGLIAIVLIDLYLPNLDLSFVMARRMITGMQIYTLLAIPFFMLAGEIMSRSGIVEDIVEFAKYFVGHIRGGLAHTTVLANILMAGLSGSAVADAAAIGSLTIPAMEKAGYGKTFGTAIATSAALIGPVIPPSIPMIILGIVAQISIVDLFIGGVIPGILMGLGLMGYVYYIAKKRGYPTSERPSKFLPLLRKTIWAILLPIIIVGGIRFGVFTPTEGGAIAAVYAMVIAKLVYKMNWEQFKESLVGAAENTGVVLLVCGMAMTLTWALTVLQLPQLLINMFQSITTNKYVFLFIVNVFLFIMGMIVDLTPNIYLLAPLLFPVAKAYGVDPVHFGVVMSVNLTIGLLTPPVGTVLLLGSAMSKVKLEDLVKELIPIYGIYFLILLIITYVPEVVLIPVHALGG